MELVPESPDSEGLPALHSAPGHLIRCAQQVHGNLWQQHVPVNLTSVQYGVLLVVGQQPDIDQRTVGELMSLDKSTAADVLLRLGRRGLLARHRDPGDGRRKLVRLTDEGRTALLSGAPAVVGIQERLLEPLSFDDGEALLRVLRLVAYRGDPPDPATATEYNAVVEGWPLRLPAIRLHTAPGHLIRRAQQVHTTLWGERVSTDLTSVQYNILLVLHHEPRIDQRTLGEHASLDKSTGADVISRLETRGLIARSRDVADGRRNLLTLSADGSHRLLHRAAAVVDVQHELLRPLSALQRQVFLSLMKRICEPVSPPAP
jgi:DNA-binding MarR family transcriptional regulator